MIVQSDEAAAVVCTSREVPGTGFQPSPTKPSILSESPNSRQEILAFKSRLKPSTTYYAFHLVVVLYSVLFVYVYFEFFRYYASIHI